MKTDVQPPRSLSRVFIERPRLAAVVAIVMAFAGILALPHLAMEEFPEIAPPQIYVSTSYAGADAQSVAETVATPLEDELNVVEGLEYYSSTCDSSGGYSCTLTFASGTDPDLAMVRVQNALKRADALLPSEVQRSGVEVEKQTSSSIAMYAFTTDGSRVSPMELGDYVSRTVKDRLTRIAGVSSVSVYGAKDYAMRIWIDPVRMTALGVSTEEIEAAISAQNLLTMLGLVLVIGSLCDDAIVVTENCQTLIERDGLSPRGAAFRCMGEITGAIIATTLVTFACYVPFVFYGGMVGRLYLQFAVSMCIALGFSTVVAIVLSPVLCSLLLRPARPSKAFAPFNAVLALSQRAYLCVTRLLVRHGGIARSAIGGAKARFRAVMMTAWSFLVGVLPLVFSSGAGCESRQAIGLVTFAGMLVATVVGIAFPPAYFAMFSRLRARSVRHV